MTPRRVKRDVAEKLDASAGKPSIENSTPQVSDIGTRSVAMRAAYLDSVMQALPALVEIFALSLPATVEKPLSERTTEELLDQIDAGKFIAEIARLWCVPAGNLYRWIGSDSDRFKRTKLARKNQAALWDWVALQVLLHAPSDRVEITRAEKIARHCRWRAAVFDRDDYGQNIRITQVEERSARQLTTQELEIIARGDVLPG